MAQVLKGFILFALLQGLLSSCTKDKNATSSTSPYMNATCNNTFIPFAGTVKTGPSEYTLTGVSAANAALQMTFYASTTGNYKLGVGLATFTNNTGESWQTTVSDTGSVTITALTSNSITGTFSFYANELKPNYNASTLVVSNGEFYLTW